MDSGDLNQKLGGNAQAFGRLVTALARACRETTNIQQYRDACAKAVAAELKRLDPKRELSDRENEIIADRFDDFFKKPRRKRPSDPEVSAPKSDAGGPAAPGPALAENGSLAASEGRAPLSERAESDASEGRAPISERATTDAQSDRPPIQPSTNPSIPSFSAIQNQKSEIQNPVEPSTSPPIPLSTPLIQSSTNPSIPLPARAVSRVTGVLAKFVSAIKNHPAPSGTEIQNAGELPSSGPPPIQPSTNPPTPSSVSSIKNPKSQIQNADDLCPNCDARLPQLLPDGKRPWPNCRICGAPPPPPPAPPVGDFCHQCRSPLPPLLSNRERPSPHCDNCGAALRPPGALIEYCPHCRACLPELLPSGKRPCPDCTACGIPAPPPPAPP